VRALALLLAWAPAAVRGAPFDGTQSLDTYTGPVIASGRAIGLGGAYVGVAEGLGGVSANPASIAHRGRHLDRTWDLDGVFTWYLPKLGDVARQDLDNDGTPDAALTGRANAQLGASAQAGRLGAGVLARGWVAAAPRPGGGSLEISTQDVSLALGWTGWREALVVGASVTASSGEVAAVLPTGLDEARLRYEAAAIRLGALWGPPGEAWRAGAAFDPGARARARGDRAAFPAPTPSAFAFPWSVSVGVSAWIGPNARRYNEPPPIALALHPEWRDGRDVAPSSRRPVLVAAQVDLVGRAADAVSIQSALVPGAEAIPSGRSANVVLRAGAEWEALADLLRVRGGSYLEPSRTGAAPRLHATFGAEARVPFWPWDLQVGLGGDVATGYQNVSLSLGFWSDLGPWRAGRPIAAPPSPALSVP
jgi:hypothetical protein